MQAIKSRNAEDARPPASLGMGYSAVSGVYFPVLFLCSINVLCLFICSVSPSFRKRMEEALPGPNDSMS